MARPEFGETLADLERRTDCRNILLVEKASQFYGCCEIAVIDLITA